MIFPHTDKPITNLTAEDIAALGMKGETPREAMRRYLNDFPIASEVLITDCDPLVWYDQLSGRDIFPTEKSKLDLSTSERKELFGKLYLYNSGNAGVMKSPEGHLLRPMLGGYNDLRSWQVHFSRNCPAHRLDTIIRTAFTAWLIYVLSEEDIPLPTLKAQQAAQV